MAQVCDTTALFYISVMRSDALTQLAAHLLRCCSNSLNAGPLLLQQAIKLLFCCCAFAKRFWKILPPILFWAHQEGQMAATKVALSRCRSWLCRRFRPERRSNQFCASSVPRPKRRRLRPEQQPKVLRHLEQPKVSMKAGLCENNRHKSHKGCRTKRASGK